MTVNNVAAEYQCNSWVLEAPYCKPTTPHPTLGADPFLPPHATQWGIVILEALTKTMMG